jgi:hypothetical protein
MVKKDLSIKELITLYDYLAVLVEAYPEPVRATDLAERADKTKPAITKMRDRLMKVCDIKAMALEKGFILASSSDIFINLFLAFAANGRHQQFLSSKFVRTIIDSKNIHSMVIAKFPLYAKYFSQDDTNFIIHQAIAVASNMEPDDLKILVRALSKERPNFTDSDFLLRLQKVFDKLQFSIKNKDELYTALLLRDKLFFLIRDYLWSQMEAMEILKSLELPERDAYAKVYKHTIDFYLRRIFGSLTEPIKKAAAKSSINIDKISFDVGASVYVQTATQ